MSLVDKEGHCYMLLFSAATKGNYVTDESYQYRSELISTSKPLI